MSPSAATPTELAEQRAQAAAELARYEALKAELQLWCLGTMALGSAAALTFYSKVRCLRLQLDAQALFQSSKVGE